MQPAGWTRRGSRADLNFVRFLSEIPRANSKSNSAEFGAGEAKTWKIVTTPTQRERFRESESRSRKSKSETAFSAGGARVYVC